MAVAATVVFTVTDFRRSYDLYSRILNIGNCFVNEKEGVAEFIALRGGAQIVLEQRAEAGGGNNPRVIIDTYDVLESAVLVEEAGGAVLRRWEEEGKPRVHVRDPDGNELELHEW